MFQEGELGKNPMSGGNLSTYKELCSLATDMGQPDLVYKFMHLANYNATWNSRKGKPKVLVSTFVLDCVIFNESAVSFLTICIYRTVKVFPITDQVFFVKLESYFSKLSGHDPDPTKDL